MTVRRTSLASVLACAFAVGSPTANASLVERVHTARAAQLGMEAALEHDDAWFSRQLLATPLSPYSAPVLQPEFTNETWWRAVVDADVHGDDEPVLLVKLRRELGLTSARPGMDVVPAPGYRDALVAAQAIKAGVDADIFWHVLDLFGYERARHAASVAVAIQLLRDAAHGVNAGRQASVGIYTDVLQRFFSARHGNDLSPHDLRYLDTLIQHGLLHPTREDDLPLTWRIARVAAAFRDAEGYVGGPPCLADATPHPVYAGTGEAGDLRPLCFAAATDRAVHHWHVTDLRSTTRATNQGQHRISGLATVVAALIPLLDIAALVEVVEATVADDLLAVESVARADAELASDRAAFAACRIPE